MAQGPEQSSPDRRIVVYSFTFILGGIMSLWLKVAGHGSLPGVIVCFGIAAGIGWGMERVLLRGATSLVGNIYGAGNITPAETYPIAETHIIRGKFAEAAEHYRDHLLAHPEDYEARLRLADLYVAHVGNYDEAERLYREVRDAREDKRRELRAGNGLIDLYTKLGRKDRLKVELARFADRYAGSQHALDARRRLDDLKADG